MSSDTQGIVKCKSYHISAEPQNVQFNAIVRDSCMIAFILEAFKS